MTPADKQEPCAMCESGMCGIHAIPEPVQVEPVDVRGPRHALELLDDVDSLVRFCSVSMSDAGRYKTGAESFWRVCRWLASCAATRPTSDLAERIQGLVAEWSDDRLQDELRLLYNHVEDDSRQFTRWNMHVAITHGISLAATALKEVNSHDRT